MTVTPKRKARAVTNLPAFTVSSDLNELFLRTEALRRGARVLASNLVLNGIAIPDTASAEDHASGALDILRIQGASLRQGFTLTGSITMMWPHGRHDDDEERTKLDFQVWGAKVVPADTTPPLITITAPANGSLVATVFPTLRVAYSDSDSGIDLASPRILVDSIDRTSESQPTGSGVSFQLQTPLVQGPHSVEVRVRDTLGNEARATTAFGIDTVPPSVVFSQPETYSILGNDSPTIDVSFFDEGSGVDSPSLLIDLDDRALPGCNVTSSHAVCDPPTLSAGFHAATASISDRAGNTSSNSISFEIILDLLAPSLVVLSPGDWAWVKSNPVTVSGTVSDDGSLAGLTVNGSNAEISGGHFQAQIPFSEGLNTIEIVAKDTSGKSTTELRNVFLDTTLPSVTIETPAQGQLTNRSAVRVTGTAIDDSGHVLVTVDGQTAAVHDERFEIDAPVSPGQNTITVSAIDAAGNMAATPRVVTRVDLPIIAITTPDDLSYLATTTIDVRGTVNDSLSSVTVNGIPAEIYGASFVVSGVPLVEGGNILTATASTIDGRTATASINVVRDLTPPRLAVLYPEDGEVRTDSGITVSGLVNDLVAGTVNTTEVSVTVNGHPALVSNRSFMLSGVALEPGPNTLSIVATDFSGNVGRASTSVRLEPPKGMHLRKVGGDQQEAAIGSLLPLPLTVQLLDEQSQPVGGKPVLFRVAGSDASLNDGKRRLVLSTDQDGYAAARLTLGTRVGVGIASVEVSSPGSEARTQFFESPLPGPATYLVADSGDQQTGIAGRELPRRLIAVATDSGHNRLHGVLVRFSVVKGQGYLLNGLRELLVFSDSDGRTVVPFVLDPEEGTANNVVEARLEGLDSSPIASFVASGRMAGEASDTSISGVVLDNSNIPIAGATLRVLDTLLTAQSDANGLFRIMGAPVGTATLIVDGTTVERPGTWPSLEFVLSTIPGRDNTVGRPIFLLPLNAGAGVSVDETHGGTLTLAEIPGFSLEIAPGSVTFAGGSRSGVISVTPVHSDKVPMVPNFGQQPRFIVTIQPAGARFEPPAHMTLPNVEGLSPGQTTEMYSFDHDLGHFVSIGPATVSEDGALIVANAGVGVVKAGWHCGGNPAVSGTPHACPGPCQICRDNRCVGGCSIRGSGASSRASVDLPFGFKSNGTCTCDDKNGCTINDQCDGLGGCKGQPVTADPIVGPCVVEVNIPATFVSITNAPHKLNWRAGDGGSPSTAFGESFTTQFSNVGANVVATGCNTFLQTKRFYVGKSCSAIEAELLEPEIAQNPTTCFDVGEVIARRKWESLYTPCASEAKWCFRLSKLSISHTYGVHGCRAKPLSDANDPLITALSCPSVIISLMPQVDPGNGCIQPTHQNFYFEAAIVAHERQHVADVAKFYDRPAFEDFQRFVADSANCTECVSGAPVEDFSREFERIFLTKIQAHPKAELECIAYAISNPMELDLIEKVRQRARAAPRSEEWPEYCK